MKLRDVEVIPALEFDEDLFSSMKVVESLL